VYGARPPLGVLERVTAIGVLPRCELAPAEAVSPGLTVIAGGLAEAVRPVASVTVRIAV
jgi:hypothetical protein